MNITLNKEDYRPVMDSRQSLVIYHDFNIMQTGFCGLVAPYWKINLNDGSIKASSDKITWLPTDIKLKIELE